MMPDHLSVGADDEPVGITTVKLALDTLPVVTRPPTDELSKVSSCYRALAGR
jgi:hypothetical protein